MALAMALSATACRATARESDGLAPEVTDINAVVGYGGEKNIPYLEQAFIDASPEDMKDGIPVGELGVDGGDRDLILKFAEEIAGDLHDNVDSMLISYRGRLLFESYYRRGRANVPHFQMSITKSYTALALGRAIQLGHLTMDDLDRPVVDFLRKIDRSKLVPGAASITLAEAMNMRSGIHLDKDVAKELMKDRSKLKGQLQVQAYLQHSAPITKKSKAFKYQGSDPAITMQVVEAVVPGSAERFIETEVLGRMGITNYAWSRDVSGPPKAAAGSGMRSRDMLKWGMLVLNRGNWRGKQLIPEAFIARATSRIQSFPKSNRHYGYFWWSSDMKVGERTYVCKSGRGAGGQFILMLPGLDLIVVTTSHVKGMGPTLAITPKRILPAFIDR